MKILYVYEKYPETYQKYLLILLEELQKKMDISILTYYKSVADYIIISYGFRDNFQRLCYKLKLSKFPSSDVKLMSNYDVIHIQHSYLWRKLEVFKKFEKRPKIVVTLRGADTYIKPWVDKRWSTFYSNTEHITAFITMSEHQKQYLFEKWNISLSKIYVIPISFGSYSNAQPKYPNKEKLKLVSAFRMTWEKNIEGTLEFAKKIKDKGIDFEFDIYGDGNDLGQLYYLIDRFELTNYVFPKRKIENDLLKEKLLDYDFFVQLSISESLGMSVIEAQSLGLPCVVSASDGLSETGINNHTMIVNDFKEIDYFVDETIKLWKDRDLYYSYSENAIKNANKNFTTEMEIQSLRQLYININQ